MKVEELKKKKKKKKREKTGVPGQVEKRHMMG